MPLPIAGGDLLTVEGLRVSTAGGDILRGVDLAVPRGAVVGVVGESGCGKTTLGLAVLGLLGKSRRVTDGQVHLGGELIGAPGVDRTAALRGTRMSFVPQDPFRSFDPLRRVGPAGLHTDAVAILLGHHLDAVDDLLRRARLLDLDHDVWPVAAADLNRPVEGDELEIWHAIDLETFLFADGVCVGAEADRARRSDHERKQHSQPRQPSNKQDTHGEHHL